MITQRIYKYRLYPSGKQKKKLLNQFSTCKEVYNLLLAESQKTQITNRFDFESLIRDIKITCPKYYSQTHSQVLQNVGDRLSKAFDNFFRRIKEQKSGKKVKAGYPRFKSRVNSITFPQSGFKLLPNKRVYASKVGNIPIILHRTPKGKIKTMTIKQNKAEQWFAMFCCETEIPQVKHPSAKKIGIDVGLENFATLSTGEAIPNPRHVIKSEQKLRLLHRRLSRKKKCSANRKKACFKLAKQHLKIANQRNDFLHKLSHNLAESYAFIAVEELNINSMLKNHWLARGIADASWGAFVSMLSYKAVTCGGQLLKNPKTKGSSHRCSNCGKYVSMPLSKRKFSCPKCFSVLHRDHNSALNHVKDTVGLTEISTPADIRPLPVIKSKASLVVEAGTTRDT